MGRAARDERRVEGHHPDYPPELPDFTSQARRLIEITDYDTSIPVTHQIELYRSNRIDCYNAWINGKLWKERIGGARPSRD